MRIASTVLAFAALTLIGTAAVAATNKPMSSSSGDGVTPYETQKWVLSASLGFGDAGYYGSGQSPMIGVAAEYGLNDKISIGGTAGYASSSYEYNYFGGSYKWTYGYTIIAARAAYHFEEQIKVKNLDPYAGVTLGYNHVSVKSPNNVNGFNYSAGASATRAGLFAGGRYWFSPKFAGFGEVGFGLGNIVLGVSTRL